MQIIIYLDIYVEENIYIKVLYETLKFKLLATFLSGKTVSQAKNPVFKKKSKTKHLNKLSWIDAFFEILISGIMTNFRFT